MDGNDICEEGGISFANMLKDNTGLYQLDLKDNGLGDTAACSIAYSLRNHPSLKILDLTCNGLTSVSMEVIAKYLIADPEESEVCKKKKYPLFHFLIFIFF